MFFICKYDRIKLNIEVLNVRRSKESTTISTLENS